MSFAKHGKHKQTWYAVYPSKKLKKKKVISINVLSKKLLIRRDRKGKLLVCRRRCPHLGADLSDGKFNRGYVVCPFHGYKISFDESRNNCKYAIQPFPVQERYGLIWIFNGPKPTHDLPKIQTKERFVVKLPAQIVNAHPHLVISNGLDVNHFNQVHDLSFTEMPKVTSSKIHVSVSFKAKSNMLLFRKKQMEASFTTYASNIAIASIEKPISFDVMFTGLDRNRKCKTQTIVFLPKSIKSIQAISLLYILLHDDVKILSKLKFQPNFNEADKAIESFHNIVNSIAEY